MALIIPSRDGSIPSSRIPLLAATCGSMVTRTSSRHAFSKRGRGERFELFPCIDRAELILYIGVVTQDMLPEVGGAFAEIFGAEGEKGWGNSEGGGKL